MGLVKVDILGLRTLDCIDLVVLKFARGSSTEAEVDEAHKSADAAVDRFLELTGPVAIG
jgi:DNA polymerase III alpha subunit